MEHFSGPAIGNLECAFFDGEICSLKSYTSILPLGKIENVAEGGFAALSLANNHVCDAGAEAFQKAEKLLVAKCPNISFFGTVSRPYAELKVEGRKIAIIGCLEPCRSRGSGIVRQEDVMGLIQRIREGFDFVFVYPHWGKEGEYTRWPSPAQRLLARAWIDKGADGVFGSHSHAFQGRETYKDKPIYYSLGNFEFDHPESRLYPGTDLGLVLELCGDGRIIEQVKQENGILRPPLEEERYLLEEISRPLEKWTTWKWAKAIGPFNLKKNTASWRIRLKKNFIKTFPKYLIWQILPKTLLFKAASIATFFSRKRNI